jgi:hypothetical protein
MYIEGNPAPLFSCPLFHSPFIQLVTSHHQIIVPMI